MRQYLDGYEKRINPEILPMMLRCYNDWTNSNRVTWPYPHGRMFQPTWVTDYFDIFEAVDELRRLEGKRPDPSAYPTLDQLDFGKPAQG